MSNLFQQFKRLLPTTALLAGQVIAHNADGTSDVRLPGNQTIRARGTQVPVGQHAFVQAGEVRGRAPALNAVTVRI